MIEQAYMKGWRKGNELKQKRLDIKVGRAVTAEREKMGKEITSILNSKETDWSDIYGLGFRLERGN